MLFKVKGVDIVKAIQQKNRYSRVEEQITDLNRISAYLDKEETYELTEEELKRFGLEWYLISNRVAKISYKRWIYER